MITNSSLKFALAFFLVGASARAAPCCSANSAAPALISGDDKMQLTLSASQASVIGDALDEGIPIFRAGNDGETTQSLRLDGAFLISDRWQLGASLPMVHHAIDRPGLNDAATALGDVAVSGAYEIVPEWTYSAWRPKGYLFSQLIFPTGKSIYETASQGGAGATGRGFFTLAVGSLWLKHGTAWDVYLMPEIHYSARRTFTDAGTGDVSTVTPGLGASATLGVGYSPGAGPLRIGLRLMPAWADRKQVQTSDGTSFTNYQLSWDAALELSCLVADDWSLIASYTDQTLIGPAVNSTLSRVFAVALQHRWPR